MKKHLLFLVMLLGAAKMSTVPARRDPFNVVQPNGDTLTVVLVGDERWHCHYTVDGYLLAQNKKGYYCYAKWTKEQPDNQGVMRRYAKPTCKKARNEAKRSKSEKKWLVRHKIPTKNS